MQFKTEEGDVRQWLTIVSASLLRHMECATYFFVAEAFSQRAFELSKSFPNRILHCRRCLGWSRLHSISSERMEAFRVSSKGTSITLSYCMRLEEATFIEMAVASLFPPYPNMDSTTVVSSASSAPWCHGEDARVSEEHLHHTR